MLNDKDFERAAAQLKVPPTRVRAVTIVESPKGGFDSTGQPWILFEAHKFSKHTGGVYDVTYPEISQPRWVPGLYSKGPNADARNAGEHKRLQQAAALNRNAALMSASWGGFQILGENYRLCGFDSVQDFVNAMYAGEPGQLDAFVEFVARQPHLLRPMQSGDAAGFAKGYNGPAYATNKYDRKLKDAGF